MNKSCNDCKDRDTCLELCPEIEKIASQDYLGSNELPIGLPRHGTWPDMVEQTYLTTREREIVTLLGKGLLREDISELLDMSRVTLRKHMSRIRKKYQE